MLISKAHIKAFRSIFEFTIPIEPKITLMIGPNESGKTNLLKSLEAFKPGFPFTNNHTCQYSDYYYQGKCPEITLEFSHLSRENRRSLITFHKAFKDIENYIEIIM